MYVLEQVRLWLVRERLTMSTCFAGVMSTSKGGPLPCMSHVTKRYPIIMYAQFSLVRWHSVSH